MGPSHDVTAYLRRIGYDEAPDPTLDTLAGIVLAHSQVIAFENLNPLLGWPVALDVAALEDKMVHGGRGGYCFEHNLLLKHALDALGFETTGLAARVLWRGPEDAITPRGHMAIRVNLDNDAFLVDVGFGGQTLTAPLRLVTDVEQPTPHGVFRLVAGPRRTLLQQVRIGGQWRATYSFDLTPTYQVDYEVTNYYLSTHPDSHFRHGLIAARPAPDGRYALLNRDLTHYRHDGTSEHQRIGTPAEFRDVLSRHFLLELPATPELDESFEKLT